jgi:uncharacterized protein YeaO (DUF488 family)
VTVIRTKRIYDAASEHDGQRVLVDRLWPRGVSKQAAALDVWSKDIAPTDTLRKWFDHRPERFQEFKRRYKKELKSNPAFEAFHNLVSRSKTTLLFAAKDRELNEAVVLAEVLETGF